MKEYDNVTTATTSISSSNDQKYDDYEIYIDDNNEYYCNDGGIEAYQICESGPVVFSSLKSSNKQMQLQNKQAKVAVTSNNTNSPASVAMFSPQSSSLPPEIRSPTIGSTKRFIYDLDSNDTNTPTSQSSKFCSGFINDDMINACPPIPTVCFSPSMDKPNNIFVEHSENVDLNTKFIQPIISESFSTDCSLQPLPQTNTRKTNACTSSVPTAVMIDANKQSPLNNCNALVITSSKESDHYVSQWCSQCCMHALQEINETCSDIIYTEGQDPNDTTSCATAAEDCVTSCLGDCFDLDALRGKRLLIESIINTALGSTSKFESSECCQSKSKNCCDMKKQKHGVSIRNRASKLNAQARRLRRLRNEMTFIHSEKTTNQNYRWIQTTQSDDDDTVDTTMDDATSAGAGNANNSCTSTALIAIYNDSAIDDCVTTSSRSLLSCPVVSSSITSYSSHGGTSTNNSNLYYDSDPGEVKLRIVSRKKNSRRAVIEKLDLMKENELWNTHARIETEKAKKNNQGMLILNDDQEENKCIQVITNGKMNLVWHPTILNEQSNLSPIVIQSWIESGSRLNRNSQFVQPKFMWKKGYNESIANRRSSFSSQINTTNTVLPHFTIDLLDICRVLPTTSINRSLHPYAKKSCSFTIETHTDTYLFECKSTKERDESVHGLKLVVARLASQLIVGDNDVYKDFFSGVGSVPGDAIDWNAIASGSA